MVDKSDFGKAVAEAWRGIKRDYIEKMPVDTSKDAPAGQGHAGVDRSVKEQVIADVDGVIKRHDGG